MFAYDAGVASRMSWVWLLRAGQHRHSALGYLAPNHFKPQLKTTSQLCPAQLAPLMIHSNGIAFTPEIGLY